MPSLIAADMAPQALHEVAAVLERPLTHLGIIKQTSPFSSFYSLSGTDIDGATVDFGAYRNKVRVVCVGLGFAPRPPRARCSALRRPRVPAVRRQVVLLLNVPIGGDWGAEDTYKARRHARGRRQPCLALSLVRRRCAPQDLRQLLDQFASRPGQPFAVLLLPCDQFQGLRERVGSSLHRLRNLGASSESLQYEAAQAAAQAAAAVRTTCETHGLKAPEVRVLAPADVNGPDAHPVWTFLKAAYGDTSDIGWNFGCAPTPAVKPHNRERARAAHAARRPGRSTRAGPHSERPRLTRAPAATRRKFVVARNGDVVGRYCPPLRPALLVRGVAAGSNAGFCGAYGTHAHAPCSAAERRHREDAGTSSAAATAASRWRGRAAQGGAAPCCRPAC